MLINKPLDLKNFQLSIIPLFGVLGDPLIVPTIFIDTYLLSLVTIQRIEMLLFFFLFALVCSNIYRDGLSIQDAIYNDLIVDNKKRSNF